MIDVLQEWGYTPELRTSEGGRVAEVTLAHCPFLELARANPAVVCGIHRGLIAGSLAQLGETATRGQPRAVRRRHDLPRARQHDHALPHQRIEGARMSPPAWTDR